MRTRVWYTWLIGTVGILCAHTAAVADGLGTSAGTLLTQSASARMAALADAGVAMALDPCVLGYNPAGLATVRGNAMSLMYEQTVGEDTYGSAVYSKGFAAGTLGVSAVLFDTGNIELFTDAGDSVNKVGQRDAAVSVGWGWKLPYVDHTLCGVSMKYIRSEIFGESADAVAGDIGVRFEQSDRIAIGAAVQNIGSALRYLSEDEPLPRQVRVGASTWFESGQSRYDVFVDAPYLVTERALLTLIGCEYTYHKLLSVRAGYRMNWEDTGSSEDRLRLGIGFALKSVLLDYSVSLADELSMPQRLSVGMRW